MPEWKKILEEAIRLSGDLSKEPREIIQGRADDGKIALLLQELRAADKSLFPINAIFPEGIPTDNRFFGRLHRLRIALGFGQPEGEIIGILASEAVGKLSENERAFILLGIADASSENIALRLEIFHQIVGDHDWPLPLLSKVFLSANDKHYLGNNGYERAVQSLASSKPGHAFELISTWLSPSPTEKSLTLGQYLLGLLRLNKTADNVQQQLVSVGKPLRGSSNTKNHIFYLRSLAPTIWPTGLTIDVLQHLQSVFDSGTPEEKLVAFGVATHLTWCPANSEDMLDASLSWLESVVNAQLPDECKVAVITMIHNASFWAKDGPLKSHLPRVADLWTKIIPVEPSNKKYWDGVDLALHDLVEKDSGAFEKVFTHLAEVEGKRLIGVIKDSMANQNRMLLYSLRQHGCVSLAENLLLSKSRRARRVGIFLYDELDVPIIDKSRLDTASERDLLLVLLELRLHHLSGLGYARLLVSFSSQVERLSPDLRASLLEDLIILGKDLPGTVLEFYKSVAGSLEVVRQALAEINAYFDGIRKADECPALKMSIPGFAKATELFGKRFSRQISESVKKYSIFAQMTSKMILLYALNHSAYQNGKLSEAQALQHVSHSEESPRIGIIAPESQAFRRLIAQNLIQQIEGGFNG